MFFYTILLFNAITICITGLSIIVIAAYDWLREAQAQKRYKKRKMERKEKLDSKK